MPQSFLQPLQASAQYAVKPNGQIYSESTDDETREGTSGDHMDRGPEDVGLVGDGKKPSYFWGPDIVVYAALSQAAFNSNNASALGEVLNNLMIDEIEPDFRLLFFMVYAARQLKYYPLIKEIISAVRLQLR